MSPASGPKLVLEGVHKAFGELAVLTGVDLAVTEHQVVSLIGASGSGKSTLLRCVNLLEAIDDGRILLDGDEISEPGRPADPVRRRIGIVFQSFNLFPHLSVLDNVTLAPHRVLGRPRREARAAALELLGRFGLADKAGDYPDRLSGGQQQRVAIVRALAMDPELMLLDEITSALDPELVGEVLAIVRELKDQGMTMLLATHEMAFAREISDVVVFLDEGRVVEQGPPSRLFADPSEERTRRFLARIVEGGRLG
jgi:polar amino acid transport system ATP-binding protein